MFKCIYMNKTVIVAMKRSSRVEAGNNRIRLV